MTIRSRSSFPPLAPSREHRREINYAAGAHRSALFLHRVFYSYSLLIINRLANRIMKEPKKHEPYLTNQEKMCLPEKKHPQT
jgi:hypothetical protein